MKKGKLFWIILVIAIIGIGALIFTNCINTSTKVNTSEFDEIVALYSDGTLTKSEIDNSQNLSTVKSKLGKNYTSIKLANVVINNYNISFDLILGYPNYNQSISFTTSYSRADGISQEMQDNLRKGNISYTYTDPNAGSIWSSLMPIFGSLIIGVIFFILIMQSQGGTKGAMNFAKTNARVVKDLRVRFSDVAGAEEEKVELQEIVDFLKSPKKFSELGARIPKGVLLVGPPGTGKTLFAKAVAGEAGVPFFSISGSDFVEMFVGVGASRVRDLFESAKKSMPCIVFIDEIDAVGRQRGAGLGGGNDEREQTLNQLLVQMDGFGTNDGIIIMAATNRVDILDPALLRPGRFDRQIYVNLPDVKGREAILKVHSRNKPLAKDVNLRTVARMTSGFSGADLENLLNESAILAARANRKEITNLDLYEGVNKVLIGPQKKSRLVTETDKRITAYHESGHAILARLLPNCDPVHEVSIIPRGMAAGYTMTRPDNDDNHMTKAKLLDDIVMTLGGRVAEELIIKDISAGASGDIQAVSKRARLMVTEWGMSDKVGPISYSSDKDVFIGRDLATHVNYSEDVASLIDQEVKKIIFDGLEKARKLLSENKKLLDTMARVLIERETIFSEEVDLIMEGKSAEEIFEYMDNNNSFLKSNPFEKNKTIIKEEKEKDNIAPEVIVKPKTVRRKKTIDNQPNEKGESINKKTEKKDSE